MVASLKPPARALKPENPLTRTHHAPFSQPSTPHKP